MAAVVINNGDSGIAVRTALNSMHAELYAPSLAGPRNLTKPLAVMLPNTLSMLRKVKSGVANGAIAAFGDSTFFGTAATSRLKDPAHVIVNALIEAGIPAECDSVCGIPSNLNYVSLPGYDSRLTFSGSGLGAGGGVKSLAGNMYKLTASGDQMTFTPEKSVDTFDVWYPAEAQFGSFSIQVDSGPVQTISQSQYGSSYSVVGGSLSVVTSPTGTDGRFGKTTIKVDTVATHTLKIVWVANGGVPAAGVQIAMVHGYRSDLKQVAVYNWGRPGETSVNWAVAGSGTWQVVTTSGKGPLTYLPVDLILLNLGINDSNPTNNVTPAQFNTAMQTLITNAKTYGQHDLAFMVPTPTSPATISLAAQQAIRGQIETLSMGNAVPVLVDIPTRWQEYAGGNAMGFYGSGETIHPGDAGYIDIYGGAVVGPLVRM